MMDSQHDLLQVILAFGPQTEFAHFLDGRNQKSQQNRDDPNDHQQFEKCDTWAFRMSDPSLRACFNSVHMVM